MSLSRPNNWFEKEVALFLWRATPPCRSITRLVSEAMDRPLPWRKRVALCLHRMICAGCDRYHDQLHFAHDTMQGLEVHLDEVSREGLPAETKEHLKHCLQAGE
jgi:hypothetical protein